MSEEDEFSIRPGTLADYSAVMAIDEDIYAGFDYMYSKYIEFCHRTDVYVFVAERKGKIVGLTCYEISNDGHTVFGIGGRLHPEYRHKGIARQLYVDTYTKLRQLHPSTLIPNHSGSIMLNQLDQHRKRLYYEPEITVSWFCIPFIKPIDDIRTALETNLDIHVGIAPPQYLSNKEAAHLLCKDTTMNTIFNTAEWFVCDNYWRPLLITNANLKKAITISNVLISNKVGTDEIEGLSLSSCCPVRTGIRLDIWYYGENEKCLLGHVKSCLQHACKILPSVRLYFQIHFPDHFDHCFVYSHLKPALGEKCIDPPFDQDKMVRVAYVVSMLF